MHVFIQILVILHFLGLAMGFSTSFASFVMFGLIAKAAPQEKAVLGRFLPPMSRVGEIGLALLWATGLLLVWLQWGGFGSLPWTFYVKLTAVVILTVTLWRIHTLVGKVRAGDVAAAARIPIFGRVAAPMALVALIFAVLTFK
jgi:hypothetical protein